MENDKKQKLRLLAFYLHEQRKFGRHSALWGLLTLGSLITTGYGVYQKNPILSVAGAEVTIFSGTCTHRTLKKRENITYWLRQARRGLSN